MNLNPYQPPAPPGPGPAPYFAGAASPSRILFVLAAIGAGLASVYWALLSLLLGLGMAVGTVSGTSLVFPLVLIVFYAVRGWQILQGNVAAARRILWLHAIGGVFAVVQMLSGNVLWMVLQGFKVAIHLFGGITAYLAYRSALVRAPVPR